MKTKDCTAARVALASNKKDPGDTNSPAEARGVARGWGEEQQDSFVGDERGKQQGGGTATTNFMNTRTILEMTFEQLRAFRLYCRFSKFRGRGAGCRGPQQGGGTLH